MKMINTSDKPCHLNTDLVAASALQGEGVRPAEKVVPPRGFVEIEDAYALRRRSGRVGADGQPSLLPSAVEQLAPQMKPYGADAQALYDQKTVDDLDHVKRAYAELERAGRASAGKLDDMMTKAKIEQAFHAGYASALGIDKPKPVAEVIVEIAPDDADADKDKDK